MRMSGMRAMGLDTKDEDGICFPYEKLPNGRSG